MGILIVAMSVAVFLKRKFKVFRIIISSLGVILIGVFSFVGLKLIKTIDFLGNMTTETVNAKTYSVVVLKDSNYAKLEDIPEEIQNDFEKSISFNTSFLYW